MSLNYTDLDGIPVKYGQTVDRPFDPVKIREIYDEPYNKNEKRLTDAQIQDLIRNPTIKKSTRLQDMSKEANQERQNLQESDKFYNLSIKQIGFKVSDTVNNVVDELIEFEPKTGVSGFVEIFAKQDRLIYLGIIIVIFSIAVILMRSSEKF